MKNPPEKRPIDLDTIWELVLKAAENPPVEAKTTARNQQRLT